MKIRAKDHNFTYPYLYDGETQATAKAYGVLATPHVYVFDADPQAALRRPVRRRGGEGRQVARRQQRGRRAARGQAGPGRDDRVFGCSTKWAEKQKPMPASPWRNGTPSRSPSNRSTWPAWPSSSRTTPRSSVLVNLWATWCGPCVAELPELVTMNRMYRGGTSSS